MHCQHVHEIESLLYELDLHFPLPNKSAFFKHPYKFSFSIHFNNTCSTGWSKATVTSNFSLASLKITKNGITQPFLESLYATILIFQCLSMVRWQKLCLSGLCLNSVFAPYCKDWEPTYPPSTSERLQFLWIPLRYPSDTPQTTPWHLQGTQHTNRHQQTHTDTPRHRQVLFEYVWQLSLGICCHLLACHVLWRRLGVSGGCLGSVWGISEWYLWKLVALRWAWGVCRFSILTV